MSHFFAYLMRMKHIRRWGLMRNASDENVLEHSQQVALVAHGLALIKNELFGGSVNAEAVAVAALYHDAAEVITGDMPTPIKYFNEEIRQAYKDIESLAQEKLMGLLPPPLQDAWRPAFAPEDPEVRHLVEAADKICALAKCIDEEAAGNREFSAAGRSIREKIEEFQAPEVRYFIDTFMPSLSLTLDELTGEG